MFSNRKMASSESIDISNISFKDVLGEGGFGQVYRAIFTTPYKGYTEAAAKSINTELVKNEVEIMKKLNHPNIVEFLGVYQKGPSTIILLECAPDGTLHQYLSKDKATAPVPEELFRKWARESSLGIQYLHEKDFLHRDIKGSNCLLFQDKLLKLSDFGISREYNRSMTTSSLKGTCGFMAPEIIVTNANGRSTFSVKSDIYAFGMLLLQIFTRKTPFAGMEWQTVSFKVGNGTKPDIPDGCPEDLADLMYDCWETDPRNRPTIQQGKY